MSPRSGAGDRKPMTRRNRAHRTGHDALSRRLSEGDPLSDRSPSRRIPVGLSTSSVFPLGVEDCFRMASEIGYDGVEVMVSVDKASRDVDRLRRWSEQYEQPILSLHAPTLFLLQHIWGLDPWVKVTRTAQMAATLGVPTVVVHPPFRWQGSYARGFVEGVAEIEAEHGVAIAVENMYPWRLGVREAMIYLPDHDPTDEDYANVTVDLSHAATAGDDAVARSLAAADALAADGIDAVVLDSETGRFRLGLARTLAGRLGAEYLHVGDIEADTIVTTVRGRAA